MGFSMGAAFLIFDRGCGREGMGRGGRAGGMVFPSGCGRRYFLICGGGCWLLPGRSRGRIRAPRDLKRTSCAFFPGMFRSTDKKMLAVHKMLGKTIPPALSPLPVLCLHIFG